jgi:alkylhydroperoxidase family enzyme
MSAAHFPAWELARATCSDKVCTMSMNLALHTTDTAPEASRPILDGLADDFGFVPNMAASIATSPTLLRSFDALRRAVGGGDLDPVLREIAGVAVGVAVDNQYGVAFHSTVLGRLGVGETEIARMRDGELPEDAKAQAVYALARDIATVRGKVDVSPARSAALTDSEILEIVAECTFAGLVGVIDNLAGRVELDSFLKDHAWASPS